MLLRCHSLRGVCTQYAIRNTQQKTHNLVQPMFAKMALPLLGGSPAVWNTSVVFFQVALLGGYCYAHAVTRRLGVRAQIGVHAALVALPLLALPIAIPAGWDPPT